MGALDQLQFPRGARRPKKRVGRGPGSGCGKTCGSGENGQNSRSGGGVRPGFEGGQMPLQRRLPKRGFRNIFKKEFAIMNVGDLSRWARESVIDPDILLAAGAIKSVRDGLKILGMGEINAALTVKAHIFSQKAKEKIEAAGGRIEVV